MVSQGQGGNDGTALVGQGLAPWSSDGEWRHTAAEIGADGCIEGTDRPLTGVLFAYLDVVTGSPPTGSMNPTVDLQVRLFAPPKRGLVRFRARTLRLGRTLYVGEAELRHGDEAAPFGVALATFMNMPVPFPDRVDPSDVSSMARSSYRRLTDVRRLGPGSFEIAAHTNTPQGTVGGAILGRLAELAAMDVFDVPAVVDELDVRFLNKVKGDSLRATATVLARRGDATTVRVEIADPGRPGALATYALAVCRDARHS